MARQQRHPYPRHLYEDTVFDLLTSWIPPLTAPLPDHCMLRDATCFNQLLAYTDSRHPGDFQAMVYLLENLTGQPIYMINEHGLGSDVHGSWLRNFPSPREVKIEITRWHCMGQRGLRWHPRNACTIVLEGKKLRQLPNGVYPPQWMHMRCTRLEYGSRPDPQGASRITVWTWCPY